MDEQLSGKQAHNLIGRPSAVRACNPEVFGRLLSRKFAKEVPVLPPDAFNPGQVVFEKMIQRSHAQQADDLYQAGRQLNQALLKPQTHGATETRRSPKVCSKVAGHSRTKLTQTSSGFGGTTPAIR
jgi:hypothetical protein